MAVGTGVTEIADSEDDSLTSSPAAVSVATVDKLFATAGQDTQAGACPHQEVAAHTANQTSDCTSVLDVNQKSLPTDFIAKHNDQPEPHSIHQAATDNASTFAVNTARQVDMLPQEVVRTAVVLKQEDLVATDRTNDRAGNPRDAGLLPEDRHASELDERATSQMEQQKRSSEPDNDLQYHSQESPIAHSGSPSVQHDETPTGHSEGPALDGYTEMELPQSDAAQSLSDKADIGEVHGVPNVSRQGSTAAVIEVLATKSGCDTASEATVTLSNAFKAHYPKAAVPERTEQDVFNEPIPMDLDVASEAVVIMSSGEMGDEHKSAPEPSAQHSAAISSLNGETRNTIRPATTSSGTAAHIDFVADIDTSIAHDPVPPSSTTDNRHSSGGQYSPGFPPIVPAFAEHGGAEVAASNHSIVASSEQDRSKDHPCAASARPEATGCRPGIVVQDTYSEDQRHDAHGSTIAEFGTISSMAVGIQPESQSTASQASEPTSPDPASKLSPQEIILAELRARKAALLSSLRVQPAIQVLMEETDDNGDEPTEKEIMAAANKIVKEHIKLLHEYNELKDVGQGLMGLIADQRGSRIVEIQDEFGIDAND